MHLLFALILAVGAPDTPPLGMPAHVKVTASYQPPASGTDAAVVVQLTPIDPHVRVNEDPAPRLKLDAAQQVLEEKPVPRRSPGPAPGEARYLDPILPVSFPVKVNARAARGEHTVKATVTYFYCSKSEGWCRKGSADVDVPVRIP